MSSARWTSISATWAWLDGERYPSATNIGRLPHFAGDKTTVETYIMDFEGNIYGENLKIELVERISPEEAFTTIEALTAKIARDVAKAREVLAADHFGKRFAEHGQVLRGAGRGRVYARPPSRRVL